MNEDRREEHFRIVRQDVRTYSIVQDTKEKKKKSLRCLQSGLHSQWATVSGWDLGMPKGKRQQTVLKIKERKDAY